MMLEEITEFPFSSLCGKYYKMLFYKEVFGKNAARKLLWGREVKCHRVALNSSQKYVTAWIMDSLWHLSGFSGGGLVLSHSK